MNITSISSKRSAIPTSSGSRKESNFDQTVLDVPARRKAVDTTVPGENAGLGLARAIAVANVLRSEPALSGMTVLPLSAGQPIIPGDRLTSAEAGDMRERRRIEIRIHQRDTPDAPCFGSGERPGDCAVRQQKSQQRQAPEPFARGAPAATEWSDGQTKAPVAASRLPE